MAIGTKYEQAFADFSTATWTISIKVEGGSSPVGFVLDDVPLIIRAVDDSPNLPWGRCRVSADIRCLDELAIFDEIRDADLQDYSVVLANDDGVAPVSMTLWADTRNMRTRIGLNALNVIRCTDGLDQLKGILWYADQATADAAGRLSVVDVLIDILNLVGLSKSTRTQFNWYPNLTDYTVNGTDPLKVTLLDVGWLYHSIHKATGGSGDDIRGVYCWDVLDHLLRRFHLKLSVSSDDYWLLRNRSAHTLDGRTMAITRGRTTRAARRPARALPHVIYATWTRRIRPYLAMSTSATRARPTNPHRSSSSIRA